MSGPSTSTHRKKTRPDSEPRARLLDGLPVTERRVQPSGVPTVVLEGGEGPPLVLLHGPGESSLWWMRVISQLVSTHRVIVPDLPGHGASAASEHVLEEDGIVEWTDQLIDQTCPSEPTLVGHLLGGGIAARWAARSARALRQLVLVDSFGLGWLLPRPRFAFGLIRFMARPSEKTYGRFLRHCMYDPGDLQEALGDRWSPFLDYNLERVEDSDARSALGTLMRNVGLPKIAPSDLARIEVPTSLIWGRHDLAVSLKTAEAASDRYGWPLYVIEEARDDPKLERPEAFLRALHGILRDSG